ncbi:MAG: bifunctional diaminohydroxyphosphoribosylaminopyrimidine deaminase/5-amino-6-(5-phosphoribosylamino)uracil reductase RibD, partial [Planctomycetota bacterium]
MTGPGDRDARYLERAAALAGEHLLDTLPNPAVGCVLARGDEIVAEGSHRGFGRPHAEADALTAAGEAARGATAYVTLEPCSGSGKKTPPCAPALLEAGISEVVYACADPTPHGEGRGVSMLEEAGVTVRQVDSNPASHLLERWLAAREGDTPWTLAKWAMTLDGKTADARGGSRWISGPESRARVHEIRGLVDAVIVGSRTAVLDDPDLRPRDVPPPKGRMPLRVVVDTTLRLSEGSQIAATAGEAPVLVATGGRERGERRRALESSGVEVIAFPSRLGRVDLRALFRALKERGVHRALLEGGGELAAAAFAEDLIHQVAAFVAPSLVGGRTAPSPVGGAEGLRVASRALRLEDV